jgi:hypothetical protein
MNFSKSDFPHLQWSLLALLLSLLISGCAIWLSSEYVAHSLTQRQFAQRQLIEARKQLSDAQSDLENMSIYSREYATLVEYKVIGGEQRLDWIEGLAKLRQSQRVVDFKYTIAPQLPYTPSPALDLGNFEPKLSGLTLHIDLLHEMQLIKFFDALRTDIKGWFIIDHCTLERAGSNNGTQVTSPQNGAAQLKAECAGGWITMKKKGSP